MFEYKVLFEFEGFDARELEKLLNEYSEKGWEYVDMDGCGYLILKRKKKKLLKK